MSRTIFLAIALCCAGAVTQGATLSTSDAQRARLQTLNWAWETLEARLYDENRVRTHLTPEAHAALRARALTAPSAAAFATTVRRFLRSLGISHTDLFTDDDLDFYFLQSLFVTRDLTTPKIHHVGAQYAETDDGFRVRAVLEGYPLWNVGVRRGDMIVSAAGAPFHPVRTFAAGKPTPLTVVRGDSSFGVDVTPVHESIQSSYLQAMSNSVRVFERAGQRLGSVHLWSGTNAAILARFVDIVTVEFAQLDGVVLDLRDGHGGAWHDYLDPFFADRDSYFVTTVLDRGDVRRRIEPEAAAPHAFYAGPLVVLINGGTRSGKESLAFQFKKSQRATLVGVTTAGAFSGGAAFFAEHGNESYVLFVAVNTLLLDGTRIEGVGVEPDVRVEARPAPGDDDKPFERAVELLLERLETH